MTIQLVAGAYLNAGEEPGPYGLTLDQSYSGEFLAYKAVWLTTSGELMGFGDLAKPDVERLMAGIGEGEAFVVVEEPEAVARFRKEPGYVMPQAELAISLKFIITTGKTHLSVREFEAEDDLPEAMQAELLTWESIGTGIPAELLYDEDAHELLEELTGVGSSATNT